MSYLKTVAFASLLFVGAGCQADTWMGFYYPDASNLLVDKRSPILKSLEECREWATFQGVLENPGGTREDDYECCKNGEYRPAADAYVCDETVQ
jgi:hypothetical protein